MSDDDEYLQAPGASESGEKSGAGSGNQKEVDGGFDGGVVAEEQASGEEGHDTGEAGLLDQESHGEEEEEEPVSTLKRLAPTFGKMPSRRRIKKPKTLEDEEEALEKQLFGDREDEGELLGDEFPSGDEGDVFNEAEEDARSRRSPGSDSDSESDDFIEMTREEREQRRKEKRFRKKNQSYGNQADLFGDAEAWAGFGGDSEEEAGSEEGYEGSAGRGSQRFHSSEDSDDGEDLRGPQREAVVSLDQFEPAVLAECFLTEQDLEITSRNVPERYQLLYGENITRGLPSATELQDEARWLGRSMDDLPIPHNEFVAFIRMVRFSKYDIPYIWHHQQAQIRELRRLGSVAHLWRLLDLDLEWITLQQRKTQIRKVFALMRDGKVYDEAILQDIQAYEDDLDRDSLTLIEAGDYLDWASFQLRLQPSLTRPDLQEHKSVANDFFTVAMRLGLVELAKSLGITPAQLDKNLQDDLTHNNEDPSESPDQLALAWIESHNGYAIGYTTPEKALAACRRIVAQQLAVQPVLRRKIRQNYPDYALLYTEPTPTGYELITGDHPYARFKRLGDKPLDKVEDFDWVSILKARKENLLKVRIAVNELGASRVLDRAKDLYLSGRNDALSSMWDEQRALILSSVLSDHLGPQLGDEIIAQRCASAERQILGQVGASFARILNRAPLSRQTAINLFRDSKFFSDDNPPPPLPEPLQQQTARVLSILYTSPRVSDGPSFSVCLSPDGNPIHDGVLQLDGLHLRERRSFNPDDKPDESTLRKQRSLNLLKLQIQRFRPHAIVVGATEAEARFFPEQVNRLLDALDKEAGPFQLNELGSDEDAEDSSDDPTSASSASSRRSSRRGATRRQRQQAPEARLEWSYKWTPILLGSLEVPTVSAVSRSYQNEFVDLSLNAKKAISLGRFHLDSLAEVSRLWRPTADDAELLSLRTLHPLQRCLDPASLYKVLERQLIDHANAVGVDINRCARFPHCETLLSFVAGLGPRKANRILKEIRGSEARHVPNRLALARYLGDNEVSSAYTGEVVGGSVWSNAIGFLRISPKFLPHLDEWDPLDDTRIHFVNYPMTLRMLSDLQGWSSKNLDLHASQEALRKLLMRCRKQPREQRAELLRLANLSLEDQGNVEEVSEMIARIQNELLEPFREPRQQLSFPSAQELFEWLTGESKATFHFGTLITCRVIRIVDQTETQFVVCVTDSGVTVNIPLYNIEGSDSVRDVRELVSIGQHIQARVDSILYENFSCRGVIRPSDTSGNSAETSDPYLRADPVKASALSSDPHHQVSDSQRAHQRKQHKQALMSRKVDHPNFKSVDFAECDRLLEDAEIGEIIIRPSSKNFDHLTISWKFYRDLNIHLDVQELDKPHPAALGRLLQLKMGDKVLEFEDLDQIIAHYIQPITTYVDLLMQHRKFLDGRQGRIEEELTRDKAAHPDMIPYYIVLNYDKPGRFRLSCKPGSSQPCKHEDIHVTRDGYLFRGKAFNDPDQVLAYFKSHSGPNARPPSSSSRYQPPMGAHAPQSSMFSYPPPPPQHHHHQQYSSAPYYPPQQPYSSGVTGSSYSFRSGYPQ